MSLVLQKMFKEEKLFQIQAQIYKAKLRLLEIVSVNKYKRFFLIICLKKKKSICLRLTVCRNKVHETQRTAEERKVRQQ